MYNEFQGCTVDVQSLRVFETTVGKSCVMYTCLVHAITLCIKLVSSMEGLIECTVNVYAHALNLNNQYLTLL